MTRVDTTVQRGRTPNYEFEAKYIDFKSMVY